MTTVWDDLRRRFTAAERARPVPTEVPKPLIGNPEGCVFRPGETLRKFAVTVLVDQDHAATAQDAIDAATSSHAAGVIASVAGRCEADQVEFSATGVGETPRRVWAVEVTGVIGGGK